MREEIQKLQEFTAQKWAGIQDISPRYPQMKSTWGSKYFSTQRGVQCPLPRVMLTYRGLLTPTCWYNQDKKNLLNSLEKVYSSNEGENEGGEEVQNEDGMRNINWNKICDMTKFARV